MENIDVEFENITDEYCEKCSCMDIELFGCVKCGLIVCPDCIEEYISDLECVCKECGW